MAWRENSNLYLNSQDIAYVDATNINTLTSVQNERGGWINNRQVVWFNVDFKTILGDLYYQYDAFQISAVFEHIIFPTGISNGTSGHWNFMMSGLDFLQNGYNQTIRNNTTEAIIRFHPNMTGTGQIYGGERDSFGVTFRKPNQYVRLSFYHTVQEAIVPDNGMYGIMVLQFNIRPCAKPSLFAHNLNARSIRLNLSTARISDDYTALRVSNEIGAWEPITTNGRARQRFSFNINMRNLLGYQWERYTHFALALEGWAFYDNTGYTSGGITQLYMRGLNFRNTYLQRRDVPSGTMNLIFWNATSLFSTGDKDSRVFPFVKQEANVKLEFDVYNYLTNAPKEVYDVFFVSQPLPNFLFNFLIMPLK